MTSAWWWPLARGKQRPGVLTKLIICLVNLNISLFASGADSTLDLGRCVERRGIQNNMSLMMPIKSREMAGVAGMFRTWQLAQAKKKPMLSSCNPLSNYKTIHSGQ